MTKINTSKTFFYILISMMLWNKYAYAANDLFIPLRIDGFNTALFNQEYPDRSLNMYSICYGNPSETYPFNLLSGFGPDILSSVVEKDSLFRMQTFFTIGAETGDMMLNRYEGVTQENRDHATRFATGCSFPGSPLKLYFGYRYLDTYSDRFDELWSRYADETGNPMTFDAQGLDYEFTGGYILPGPFAATGLRTGSYKHWGATPYYFSPVFSSGYLLAPTLYFTLPKSVLNIDFLFDYHKDFYNHKTYTEYTDESWDIAWRRELSRGVVAEISHHKNPRVNPTTRVCASLRDTIMESLSWKIAGNVYGNMRLGGSMDVSYAPWKRLAFDINTAWDFIPQSREYTFMENNSPVEYHSLMYENASLHAALRYTDTLFFPVKAAVWVRYCEKPLWETVEFTGNKTIIRQDTIHGAARLTAGGKGSYDIMFRDFFITLWGNAAITPENALRFSLPLDIGADFGYGKPDNDSLYAACRFEFRDRASLKYWNINNNIFIESASPALTSLSFMVKIPFNLPLIDRFTRTNVHIEAGPIQLSKEQRLVEHPRGNLIGPAISIGVQGFLN